jgi:hypothetical protein
MHSGLLTRIFSFKAVVLTAIFILPLLVSPALGEGFTLLRDPDIWWHLKNAQVLFTSGHFIRQDLYSFTTANLPWVNSEWLAEIPFYTAFRFLGPRGVFFVTLAATDLILLGVFALSYLRTRASSPAFMATFLAVFLATVNLGPRTILFGYICFIVELAILWAFRAGRDYTWSLPLLFALWINTHGSWLIGLVFLSLFVAAGFLPGEWGALEAARWSSQQRRKLLLTSVISVAALFANPYGWRLVVYPFDMAFSQKVNIKFAQEWQTLNFHAAVGKLMFATLALLLTLNIIRRRIWPLHEYLFLLLAVFSAFTYMRFTFLAGIVICPMLATDFSRFSKRSPEKEKLDRPFLNAALMAAFVALALWRVPTQQQTQVDILNSYPTTILAQLDPHTRVFNTPEWGGYMAWTGHSDFLDTRLDIFDHHGVLLDCVKALGLQDSLSILDKYQIEAVLLTKGTPLAYFLSHTSEWQVVAEEKAAVLFRRRPVSAVPGRALLAQPNGMTSGN